VVRENGVALAVDVRSGQKTGFFLDQRENRFALRRYARGARRALNCFSYTGGFSLALALGGAREIVSVDRSTSAARAAAKPARARSSPAEARNADASVTQIRNCRLMPQNRTTSPPDATTLWTRRPGVAIENRRAPV